MEIDSTGFGLFLTAITSDLKVLHIAGAAFSTPRVERIPDDDLGLPVDPPGDPFATPRVEHVVALSAPGEELLLRYVFAAFLAPGSAGRGVSWIADQFQIVQDDGVHRGIAQLKFRFCGEGDCPDWVLAEIHSNLAVLGVEQLAEVAQHVAKCIAGGEDVPEDKVRAIFGITKGTMDSPKAAFACIRFLLVSAARFSTESSVFGTELQQLGLPKDHTTVMCRVLEEYVGQIRTKLRQSSLTINELENVTSSIPENTIDCVQLQLGIKNEIINGVPQRTTHAVNINRCDVPVLLKELKTIKAIMDGYDYEAKHSELK